MILVTVGAQMPFDRLVATVDDWARERARTDVFAQIGDDGIPPTHVSFERKLTPAQFREKVLSATVIVSHAGMGTILTALEHGKPILVMPRRAALRETRNDHQVATAEKLQELEMVSVALDELELRAGLDRLGDVRAASPIAPVASAELIDAIRRFVLST